MDKNEIPRSSGGASKQGAPPASTPARVQVTWTTAARRVPLALESDVRPDATAKPAAPSRAALNKAVKRAVEISLRLAPLKVSTVVASSPLEVDLSFVSDAEIARLNEDYRGKPRPTDVLSFSQCEDEEMIPLLPAALEIGQDRDAAVHLGDIVISIETALRQAGELKHDLLTEATFLAVHGALHLCGYDHGTASQRRTMWKWQEIIVAALTPGDQEEVLQVERLGARKRRKLATVA